MDLGIDQLAASRGCAELCDGDCGKEYVVTVKFYVDAANAEYAKRVVNAALIVAEDRSVLYDRHVQNRTINEEVEVLCG